MREGGVCFHILMDRLGLCNPLSTKHIPSCDVILCTASCAKIQGANRAFSLKVHSEAILSYFICPDQSELDQPSHPHT